MARSRNIKPGFFKNEDLAECSAFARLCFAGLWTLADREGRLEDRPKRIKGDLFAYDSVDVDPLLDELVKWKFIERYSIDGVAIIQILSFHKHQNPHFKELPSIFPPPESLGLDPHSMDTKPETAPPLNEDEASDKPEAAPPLNRAADPPLNGGQTGLIPESLFSDSLNPIAAKPRLRVAATKGVPEKPESVQQETWDDWLALRRKKSAPVTGTVLREATKEAQKAGISLDRFLSIWCVRGSQGLQAEWLRGSELASVGGSPKAWEGAR